MSDLTIFCADACDLSPDDLSAFDVQITDFPYSEHVHANAASVGNADDNAPGHEGMGAHARDLGFAHLSPALLMAGALAAACVKRWSVIFADHEGADGWRNGARACGAEYIRLVPWIRWSQPQLSGDRPCSGSEAVLLFHATGDKGRPVRKHWNGPGSLTHFDRRCMRGKEKHPTEKPIDLMLDLVGYFSDPGETVVDLCAGSGTTALACRLLKRGCVGFENDPRWAASAQRRIADRLSLRDVDRAQEWCVSVAAEAERVPAPSAPDGSDVKTWERAQRRLADVARVMAAL